MGTWGTQLYEDDTALDARSDFLEYRKSGMGVKAAEQAVIDEAQDTFDGEPEWIDITWLALCCAELETGTLSQLAKSKALEIIDSKRQYDFWIEYGGDKTDAGARSREMALIKKYITAYDETPVKRKSWLALQKADREYAESIAADTPEPNVSHRQVKNIKFWSSGNRFRTFTRVLGVLILLRLLSLLFS